MILLQGAQEVIDLFRTSLNGPARNWYNLNVTGEQNGRSNCGRIGKPSRQNS